VHSTLLQLLSLHLLVGQLWLLQWLQLVQPQLLKQPAGLKLSCSLAAAAVAHPRDVQQQGR
jgi:hypothetical protein